MYMDIKVCPSLRGSDTFQYTYIHFNIQYTFFYSQCQPIKLEYNRPTMPRLNIYNI